MNKHRELWYDDGMQPQVEQRDSLRGETIFNGICLFIFICGMGLFLIWTPWLHCHPLSELDISTHPDLSIPPEAECFTAGHGLVTFHWKALVWENTLGFLAFAVVAILPACMLLTYLYARGRRANDQERSG